MTTWQFALPLCKNVESWLLQERNFEIIFYWKRRQLIKPENEINA